MTLLARLAARLTPTRRRPSVEVPQARAEELEREIAGVRRSYERIAVERRAQPPWMRYLTRNAVFASSVAALDGVGIGLVLAHDSPSLPGAVALGARAGAPVVFDAVDVPDLGDRSSASYQGFDDDPHGVAAVAAYEASLIEECTATLTVSDGMKRWLLTRNPGVPVTVVRNHRAAFESAAASATDTLRTLGPGTYVVVPNASYPGTGAELAIEAIARLPAEYKLVLAGEARPKGYGATLRSRAEELGVGDRVHLPGLVEPDQVVAQLRTADLALICFEPTIANMRLALPNRLFEALAADLPVVCGPLPEIAEVVSRFDVGQPFDVQTPDAAANAIRSVVARLDDGGFGDALATANGQLMWEHEQHALREVFPACADRPRGVIVANKLLAKNRRVPRLARVLVELGYDVEIVSREISHPSLRPAGVRYWLAAGGELTADPNPPDTDSHR